MIIPILAIVSRLFLGANAPEIVGIMWIGDPCSTLYHHHTFWRGLTKYKHFRSIIQDHMRSTDTTGEQQEQFKRLERSTYMASRHLVQPVILALSLCLVPCLLAFFSSYHVSETGQVHKSMGYLMYFLLQVVLKISWLRHALLELHVTEVPSPSFEQEKKFQGRQITTRHLCRAILKGGAITMVLGFLCQPNVHQVC
jgi:hypothetical protein